MSPIPEDLRQRGRRTRDELQEHFGVNGNGVMREPRMTLAKDVTPEKIEWLWPGRLARGKITLLEGDPGLGKSTLTLEIAARLSTGRPLPGGLQLAPTGTLFLSAEDGVADTIVPRLMAAGADLGRIGILEGITTAQGEEGVQLPRDLDLIEGVMTALGASLVVVDPLSVFLGDDISENRNQEVRKALAPAKAMFERARVSGLLLRHLTKSQSANPVYRGAGSIGLGGAARAVMMVAEDPEIPGLRVLANVKENLSKPTPSLSYRLVSSQVDPDVGQIEWTGESRWSAKDLQFGPDDEDDLGPKLADAVEWLRDYLHGGVVVLAKQLVRDADKQGIKERTLKRARKELGVVARKGTDGAWGVALPEQEGQQGQRGPTEGGQDLARGNKLWPPCPLPENQRNNNNNNVFSSGTLAGTLAGTLEECQEGQEGHGVLGKAPWEE